MRSLSHTMHTGTTRTSLIALAAALVVCVAMALLPTQAFATGTEDAEGTVETITTSSGTEFSPMGNDYVWAGESLVLEGTEAQNDILAAGHTLLVDGCKVGGSVRMAGQVVRLANTTAQENITLAGQDVCVDDSTGNAVALAGQTAEFSGTCSELTMYAGEVLIDGTVNGDVTVGANAVTVGPHARIAGTLHISASQEPEVSPKAEVLNLEYSESDEDDIAVGQMGVVASGLSAAFVVVMGLVSVVGTLVVAVCAEWLFARHTKAAASLARSRTGATVGSGVIGTLLAPIVIILLCLFIVTLPVALCVALAMIAMAVVASGFAAASLAKLAFPRIGRFAGALAGGAIVSIAEVVPVLGTLVSLAAFMYFVGYVLQSIYLGMRREGRDDSGLQEEPEQRPSALPEPPAGC